MSDPGSEHDQRLADKRAARLQRIIDDNADYRAHRAAHDDAPPGEENLDDPDDGLDGVLSPVGWGRTRELGTLTPAEAEVVQGAADGENVDETAVRIHKSPHTVRSHLRLARWSMRMHTKAGMVAEALRKGLIR